MAIIEHDLLDLDTKYPDCTSINTQRWLDHVLGTVISGWQEHLEALDAAQESYNRMRLERATPEELPDLQWSLPSNRPYTGRYWICDDMMQRAIAQFLEEKTGRAYVRAHDVDNVYNDENCFGQVFQYQVWVPEEDAAFCTKANEWYCDEWYYRDDVYVAVELHHGGDVRGNYGTVQLRGPVSDLCDAGFLEWSIGWSAFFANGDRDESVEAEHMCQGYTTWPHGQVEEYCKWGPRWSEKRKAFVAVNHAGRCVELSPDYYVRGA